MKKRWIRIVVLLVILAGAYVVKTYRLDLFSTNTVMENTSPDGPVYSGGAYKTYEGVLPTSGDIVLFFHADRCPTCIAAKKDILAKGLPAGLTVLEVDYDTEHELRKKYQILTQSSYAYVQPDGTLIKRWV